MRDDLVKTIIFILCFISFSTSISSQDKGRGESYSDIVEEQRETYNKAIDIINEGDYVRARDLLESLDDNSFKRIDYKYIALARVYIYLRYYTKAKESLEKAEKLAQDDSTKKMVHDLMGYYFEEKHLYKSAVEEYKKGDEVGQDWLKELEKKFEFKFNVSPIFDTNPLSVAKESTSALGGKKYKSNDYGATTSFRIRYNIHKDDFWKITSEIGETHTQYVKNPSLRTDVVYANLKTDMNLDPARIGFYLNYKKFLIGGDTYENNFKPEVRFSIKESDQFETAFSIYYTKRQYTNVSFEEDPFMKQFTDRDGVIRGVSVSEQFRFTGFRQAWSGELGIKYEKENTQGTDFDSTHKGIFFGINSEEIFGFRPYLNFDYTKSDYENLNSVPYFTKKRDDETLSIGVGGTKDITSNISLYFYYNFIDRRSNISEFDYDRNIFSIGFQFSF